MPEEDVEARPRQSQSDEACLRNIAGVAGDGNRKHAWLTFMLSSVFLVCACSLAAPRAPAPDAADADSLIRTGHWKRARAILEPQVSVHPQDAKIAYQLAQVKMALKDFAGALPLARHAVELDVENSNYHLKLGQVYGEMAARASIFAAGSLALKFRKEVEIALQLDPKNLDALDSMMQFKFQAPGFMGGDKKRARALAEEITRLNPSQGYLAHAEIAELEKNQVEVKAWLAKAVEADPRNYRALKELAEFYTYSPHAEYDAAINYAHQALHLDPTRVDAYWILARAFVLQGRWGDLDTILANAERSVPDDLRPFYEAARTLLEAGKDYPRAEGYIRKYLSQEPEGEEPDVADAHRLLGLVFEKEGRSAEARAEILTALRLKRDFRSAKDDLKRMERR
jgi:tetratricopeptide (TPR) repeat protein